MSVPIVSVIMAVYNGGKTVKRAIDSILQQTLTEFKFIIVNDGSTDGTAVILKKYRDPRIVVLTNERNEGLQYSLNRAIDNSEGEYIARMDADDYSMPQRLAVQIDFCNRNPHIGVCGSWVRGGNSIFSTLWKYPCDHEDIKALLLFESCIAHPSIVFRKSAFSKELLHYDPTYKRCEDYELWTKLILHAQFSVVPEPLLNYTVIKGTGKRPSEQLMQNIWNRYLDSAGFKLTEEEKSLHSTMCQMTRNDATPELVDRSEKYLLRLIKMNNQLNYFNPDALKRAVAGRWYKICYTSIKMGPGIAKRYLASSLRNRKNLTSDEIKLIIRSYLKK